MFGIFGKGVKAMTGELWKITRQATGEALGKIAVERTRQIVVENPRNEVYAVFQALRQKSPEAGVRLRKRLEEALKTGKPDSENNIVVALGNVIPHKDDKIQLAQAVSIYAEIADLDDEEFAFWVELMKHDPFVQILRNLIAKLGPAANLGVRGFLYSAGFVAETVRQAAKLGVEKLPELNEQAEEAVLRWRANQTWIKRSRKRQDRLENQLRGLQERQTRERVTEAYNQFRRDWAERRS